MNRRDYPIVRLFHALNEASPYWMVKWQHNYQLVFRHPIPEAYRLGKSYTGRVMYLHDYVNLASAICLEHFVREGNTSPNTTIERSGSGATDLCFSIDKPQYNFGYPMTDVEIRESHGERRSVDHIVRAWEKEYVTNSTNNVT